MKYAVPWNSSEHMRKARFRELTMSKNQTCQRRSHASGVCSFPDWPGFLPCYEYHYNVRQCEAGTGQYWCCKYAVWAFLIHRNGRTSPLQLVFQYVWREERARKNLRSNTRMRHVNPPTASRSYGIHCSPFDFSNNVLVKPIAWVSSLR